MINNITPYIDFQIIPSDDCRVIMVADLSVYAHLQGQPVFIDIVIPGYSKPIELSFSPNQLNILNANNLGLSQAITPDNLPNLPDGIYTITVRMCPFDSFTVTKTILQNCQQICDFRNQLISMDLLCECDNNAEKARIKLNDISLLIEASKAHAARCNVIKAMEHYKKADRMLCQLKDFCV